jgi:hypothetical protein
MFVSVMTHWLQVYLDEPFISQAPVGESEQTCAASGQQPLEAGWSLGWVSTINSNGQTIWIVDAHRDDGKRFIVHADEKTQRVC